MDVYAPKVGYIYIKIDFLIRQGRYIENRLSRTSVCCCGVWRVREGYSKAVVGVTGSGGKRGK